MAPFLYYSLILTEYILLLNMFAAIVVQNMAIVKAGLSVYVFASLLKPVLSRGVSQDCCRSKPITC